MARNFIPLVPSGTIGADADVAQLEQDVLAMDSRVGELAEDVGTIEQWDAGDIPFDDSETYASGSVGADLTNVKSDITQLDNDVTKITGNTIATGWVANKYIKTDGETVNVSSPTANGSYTYLLLNASPGDYFGIKGQGAVAAKLWCFIDSSGNVLSVAENNITSTTDYVVVKAPANTSKAIFNSKNNVTYECVIGDPLLCRIADIEKKLIYSVQPTLTFKSGYIRNDTGGVVSNAVYYYSELPTVPGQKIIYNAGFNANSLISLCFYTVDGDFVAAGALAKNYDQLLTTPENAYILKATIKDASNTGYIKYGSDESVVKNLSEIAAYVERNDATPKLVLPAESVAVIGHEWNMYYQNVIFGFSDQYYVKCRCTGDGLGRKALSDCLRFTPGSGESGTYTVTIDVYNRVNNSLVDSGTFTLRVIADSAISGKKAIFIGDSFTDDGVYPAEIQYNLSDGGIVSIGTITESITYGGSTYSVSHEGRGGWSTTDYCTKASVDTVTNPFYNPSTQKFDFSYYVSQNSISGINAVSIYLGTNGDSSFDVTVENIKTMIESIHDYDSDILVLINTFHQAAGQDGCGNHTGLQSSGQVRYERLSWSKAILDNFENNAELTNVYASTVYFGVDGEHDYPTVTQALSARNTDTIVRQNNNVHPATAGYLKIADSIYNQMLYLLS